jgi:putative transcriptional regulator
MKNRLKELRQMRQWSQSDLARELGISRQAVNGFESGKFAPSLEMAFKIAKLFEVAIESIFIDEARNSMQMLIEQVKTFFGFEFGFERFTPEAIQAIQLAQSAAARSHGSQVEPEHLLAGLLANSDTIASHLLQANSLTLPGEDSQDTISPHENLKLSPPSKFVLELALQIVRLQGKRSIGTEHLLWGLLRLTETNQSNLNPLFKQYEISLKSLNRELLGYL